jgi:signal peptidase I
VSGTARDGARDRARDGARDGDAGWLNYDGETPEAAEVDANNQDQRVVTTDPAWLRHDLPQDSDTTSHGPTDVPTRDSAWLAPDLDVATPHPTPGDGHDTGVPPTLAEPESPVESTVESPVESQDRRPAPEHTQVVTQPLPDEAPDAPDESTGPRKGRHADDEPVGGLAVLLAAVKEFAIVVGMALVLSFIVKTWLLQAFYIPSGSMEDTLVLNDRVIVSKLTPGPIDLKRGDIIVFADPGQWLDETPPVQRGPLATVVSETLTFVGLLPDNAENHLIKRVIGLPGDHVVCCDEGGRITINGTAIKEPYLKPGDAASEQDFDITVPSGRVWVMGDHRSNSADSRAHDGPDNNGSQGSVDERLIVGRAVALVWPLDHLTWLSNPTATFASVPAPDPNGSDAPTDDPKGGPTTGGADGGADGEGGGEVGGTDAPTGTG